MLDAALKRWRLAEYNFRLFRALQVNARAQSRKGFEKH
jgi:hypothetical protein